MHKEKEVMLRRLVVAVTILFSLVVFASAATAQENAAAEVQKPGTEAAAPAPAVDVAPTPAVDAAPAPAVPQEIKESYKVYFAPSKLGPKYKGVENLAGEFLLKDKRFQIVRSAREADYTIEFRLVGNKLSIIATTSGTITKEQTYETDLGAKFADLALMGEIRRGLRELFVYNPEKSKVMVKLYAFTEGEEGDAGQVETAIWELIRSECEEVMADPYKFAIKADDIKALLKTSDMKALKVFKDNGVDMVVFGVLDMPTLKDVGGSEENLFQGTMHAEIKAIDTASGRVFSYVKSDFTGQGQYSELQFNLMEGASKYVADTLWKEIGLPRAGDDATQDAEEDEDPNLDGERSNGPTFD